MKIFVVGQIKSASREFAKRLGEKHNIPVFYEEDIGLQNYEECKKKWEEEPEGVFKVALMSHKLPELSQLGDVYWVDRHDRMALYASMKAFNFIGTVWDVLDDFKKEFPNDHIWSKFNRLDEWRYLELCVWSVRLREYFKNKYFKDIKCETVYLEDQEWFNEKQMVSYIKPLLERGQKVVNETNLECDKCLL